MNNKFLTKIKPFFSLSNAVEHFSINAVEYFNVGEKVAFKVDVATGSRNYEAKCYEGTVIGYLSESLMIIKEDNNLVNYSITPKNVFHI